MSPNSCNIGYIYIYKCVVGNVDNICKIGKTTHFRDKHCRIVQSLRTPYFGFMPYMQFDGTPIVTGFKVKDVDAADDAVRENFKRQQKQISTLELYVTDYNDGIKELCVFLKQQNQFIELVEDGITDYDFLKLDDSIDTSKSSFMNLLDSILLKYNKIPDELLPLFKAEDDFKEKCSTHYKSGNYVSIDNLVLDLHVNRSKRIDLFSRISEVL